MYFLKAKSRKYNFGEVKLSLQKNKMRKGKGSDSSTSGLSLCVEVQ